MSGSDALWFKDAVFYEVPIKSFMDASGDGIGDLRGLTARLDYIRDLGVDCIHTGVVQRVVRVDPSDHHRGVD